MKPSDYHVKITPMPDVKPPVTHPYETFGYHIPARMWTPLQDYIKEGKPVGDFLKAVLSNDLQKAVSNADQENLENLPAYVYYLYNHAPADCWGSKEKVKTWMERENEAWSKGKD